jgi:hypothetical protein
VLHALDLQVGLERVDLPPVRVAPHRDVDQAEQRLEPLDAPRHHDHPGAGPKDRHARARTFDDGLDESGAPCEL